MQINEKAKSWQSPGLRNKRTLHLMSKESFHFLSSLFQVLMERYKVRLIRQFARGIFFPETVFDNFLRVFLL